MSNASIQLLTRDQILAASDTVYEYVNCPEWGGTLKVRSLNGRQRALWQESSLVQKGKDSRVNFQLTTIKLVVLAVVDENDKPVFTDADISSLARKNSAALERIANTAMRLSGIGEEEMETITGNSGASESDDSL